MRASGFTPRALAFSALSTTSAAAPSLICEAFAAVTVPPSWKAGLSFAIPSAVASARMPSSAVNATGEPFFCGICTASFSGSKRPAAVASAALRCEAAANSSCALRGISYFLATSSAVAPMWKSL
jgi:hypothetical protein